MQRILIIGIFFMSMMQHTITYALTELVSVGDPTVFISGGGSYPSVSSGGRYVAFESGISELVPGDTNGRSDIFVRDMQTNTIIRASVDSIGTQSNGESYRPSISADGRYVAFMSVADNLAANDTNGESDIFVRDMQTNTTTRVSVDSAGGGGNHASIYPSISTDGRYVTFASEANNLVPGDTNNVYDIFVRDLHTNTTTRVSVDSAGNQANNSTYPSSISSDGRYVAFQSNASNLVAGDTNGAPDIFVRDTVNNTTTRVSVDSLGNEANNASENPVISDNGRYVIFQSEANNLTANDTNTSYDVFMRDMQTNTTTKISFGATGNEGDDSSFPLDISADGRYVVFLSNATNLVSGDTNGFQDIFVRDTTNQTTTLLSKDMNGTIGDGQSEGARISADGGYVVYVTSSSNLGTTPGGIVRVSLSLPGVDVGGKGYSIASLDSSGNQANGQSRDSYPSAISADDRYIAFSSYATNLVAGDTNGVGDIFVRDRINNTTVRVSVDGAGNEGNAVSYQPSISADGRYVAFVSNASNLVAGDTNGYADVFVRDTVNNTTSIVSVDNAGNEGNESSYWPSISADGRYVVFESIATNLDPGNLNVTESDIFLRDTVNQTTTTISPFGGHNAFSNSKTISADGRYVVSQYESDIYVSDLQTNTTTIVSSQGYQPTISADGRYVAFVSNDSNLVSGDTNGAHDVFVRDLQTNTTVRVSVDNAGNEMNGNVQYYPQISADGRYVSFGWESWEFFTYLRDTVDNTTILIATDTSQSFIPSISPSGKYVTFAYSANDLLPWDVNNEWDIYIRKLTESVPTITAIEPVVVYSTYNTLGESESSSMSSDGRYVVFSSASNNLVSGDTNNSVDIFVRDMQTNITTRVSVDSSGNQANNYSVTPRVSSDGRYVAFFSAANNLVPGDTNGVGDIFVRDAVNGTTTRVSVNSAGNESDGQSEYPLGISADGSYVVFYSEATNLVPGDTNGYVDVFVRDLQTHTTTRVSVDSAGNQVNGDSSAPSISADGRYVVFGSAASNLVSGDTNGVGDIFVRDLQTNITTRVSVDSSGVEGNNYSYQPSISADGRYVSFESHSNNLVPGDTNGVQDIFVRDLQTNTTTRVSVDSAGNQGNSPSARADISADGRYVSFESHSNNLVPGDTNSTADIFVRDLQTNTTRRVSLDSAGNQGNNSSRESRISADGEYVTFASYATNFDSRVAGYGNIFRVGLSPSYVSGTGTIRVSISDGEEQVYGSSDRGRTSADGRYTVFRSLGTGLVVGDTNGVGDIFVRDEQLGTTTRVNVSSTGVQANDNSDNGFISADGRYVTYWSYANNLVVGDSNGQGDVFQRDMQTNTTVRVSTGVGGDSNGYSIVMDVSSDGRYVVFYSNATNLVAGGSNGKHHVYVKDMQTNTTNRVSVDSAGVIGNGDSYYASISDDGRYIVFDSYSSNLVAGDTNGQGDLFMRDMQTNTTSRVSVDSVGNQSNGESSRPSMSADGRYVTYWSDASNLVANDTNGGHDVFMRDMQTNTTSRVSAGVGGGDANGGSNWPSMSNDGRYVIYESHASNIVPNDTNGQQDVFVWERVSGKQVRVSNGNMSAYHGDMSADGEYVVYSSDGSNVVLNDTNGVRDVFREGFGGIGSGIDITMTSPSSGSVITTGTVVISGTGTVNSSVVLSVSGSIYTGSVSSTGVWTVTLLSQMNGVYAVSAQTIMNGEMSNVVRGIYTVAIPVSNPGGGGSTFGGGGGVIVIGNAPQSIGPVPQGGNVKGEVKEEKKDQVKDLKGDTKFPINEIKMAPKDEQKPTESLTAVVGSNPLKEAIVQTNRIGVGTTVEINMAVNPVLESEKQCYSPNEIVNITLGKNTSNKDQVMYQALLKSYDLTIFSDTDLYRPDSRLKRNEAAKMLVKFAKHVLCREAVKEYSEGMYTDIEGTDSTLLPYIKQAYEYGIFKGSQGKFRPREEISRKEFVAGLMRMFMNENMDIVDAGDDWDQVYVRLFREYGLDKIVGNNEEIGRYEMSKIIYKLYYNPTYEWTERGYVLPDVTRK